jgi:hypothetical protein
MDAPGTIPRPLVVPAPGSRLEQLLDMQAAAEAAVTDAEANLKMIKDGIKAESAAAAQLLLPQGTPLPPVIDIAGTAHRPGLTQRWKVPRRLNRKRLDRDHPGLWDEYAEYGDGFWELRAAK